jgi:hypothetical protein
MKSLLLACALALGPVDAAYAGCTGPVVDGVCHGQHVPDGGDFREKPDTPYPPPPGTIRNPDESGTPIYERGERTCTGPIVDGVCHGAVL